MLFDWRRGRREPCHNVRPIEPESSLSWRYALLWLRCVRSSRILAQIFGVGSARVEGSRLKRERAQRKESLHTLGEGEGAMTRIRGTTVIMGLCVALAASAGWAESSPFVGRWHWNRAQSTLPPGEPSPNDVVSEISRADGNSVTWSVTIVTPDGPPHVVTLEAGADREFYRCFSRSDPSARPIGSRPATA